MSDHAITIAERREILSLKIRAWSGKPRTNKKKSAPSTARSSVAPGLPPLQFRARLAFSKHTPWEELELLRVDLGPRAMVVPDHLLITGDRVWRRWEGW